MNHPIETEKCYVVHQGFGDIYETFGGTDVTQALEKKLKEQYKL